MNRILVLVFFILSIPMALFSSIFVEKHDSLKVLLMGEKNIHRRTKLLLQLSRETELFNPVLSLEYASDANKLAQLTRNDTSIVKSLISLSKNYLALNDYKNAIAFGEQALGLAQNSGLKREAAISGNTIAVIYAELGDYDRSSQYYFQSIRIFEQINDLIEMGVTYGNIGADFLSQKNYAKAIEYSGKSLEIARKASDDIGICQQMSNLGAVYLEGLNNHQKARSCFNQAAAIASERNDYQMSGVISSNMGLLFAREKKYDSAIIMYKRAYGYYEKISNKYRMAEALILLGKLYIELGRIDDCILVAQKVLETGFEFGAKRLIFNASSLLKTAYITIRDTSSAYKYAEIREAAKDSLLKMQSQKALFKAELQFNHERLAKEMKYKQMRSYFILGFVIMFLVTGLILTYLFYSRQKVKTKNIALEKEMVETALSFKNKELSANLMTLLKKNEMLTDISKKLSSIEKADSEDAKTAVARLNREIKHKSDDTIWKEFSHRFNETNSEFYNKVLAQFPDLSNSELKLCAYLRLNMTTKEIADLTGQSIQAVEKARYRLRKKLGIANSDQNLVNFLNQV